MIASVNYSLYINLSPYRAVTLSDNSSYTNISPSFVPHAISVDFGLILVHHTQSLAVHASIKKPPSRVYNCTLLLLPDMAIYSPLELICNGSYVKSIRVPIC